MRTGIIELRAQIAAAEGDFVTSTKLIDEFLRRRSGYLELSGLSVLGLFYAISWHAHIGDPVPMIDVRRAWDVLDRHGGDNPSWRAASATAITLTAHDHRDLGIRFLRWSARISENNINGLYHDELDRFDLPTDPEGPDEDRDELLAELDFL